MCVCVRVCFCHFFLLLCQTVQIQLDKLTDYGLEVFRINITQQDYSLKL